MDLFGKKRIEHLEGRVLELEAQIREMKNREASLQVRHERRKKELKEREKDLFMRVWLRPVSLIGCRRSFAGSERPP